MLKHCSQSCVDVSRRSLRHKSFSLDSRFGMSADMLDSLGPDRAEMDYRSYCANSSGSSSSYSGSNNSYSGSNNSYSGSSSYAGMVTLPRNKNKLATDSCLSLPNFSNVSAIKVYAQCLRPHLAYKTVIITRHTTSRQVVLGLLSRFRMKHRDPRLFYLTMEVNIGERSRTISLEDGSCIADLILCNPWGTCRFRLKARQGGLVKIYDGEVRTDSVYKSIIISQDTSVQDTISILGECYSSLEDRGLSLVEFDMESGVRRLLALHEKPLEIKDEWEKNSQKVFQLRQSEQVRLSLPCDADLVSDLMSRGMVRNSILRQSIRKKQFMKTMLCETSNLELDNRNLFSLSRFSLSDQIISEDGEEGVATPTYMEDGPGHAYSEDGEEECTTSVIHSEPDLNSSTSGVSSLSCSSLDSIGASDSFFT